MRDAIISFLIQQYGHRVDHPQPIVDTSTEIINQQLRLVAARMKKTKIAAMFWLIIGVVYLTMNAVKLASAFDALAIFQALVGIIFFVSGVVYLYRYADLKQKEIILKTLSFVKQAST